MENKLAKIPIVVIAGETASGKSSVAMEMAQNINGEIVCADSRTVYRDMNIGTAKPTEQDQKLVKHWCLDLVNPDQEFSVYDFQLAALQAIDDIRSRGKIPIVVGGSGLYINSVVYDYDFRQNNKQNRNQYNDMTIEQLIDICKKYNYQLPDDIKNKRRLIRTIESKGKYCKNNNVRQDVIYVAINNQKQILEDRIRLRINQMLDEGVVEETKFILNKYNLTEESSSSNIYKIIKQFLDKQLDYEQIIEKAVIKDRQLAKKQRTWFKRDKNIIWLNREDAVDFVIKKVKQF